MHSGTERKICILQPEGCLLYDPQVRLSHLSSLRGGLSAVPAGCPHREHSAFLLLTKRVLRQVHRFYDKECKIQGEFSLFLYEVRFLSSQFLLWDLKDPVWVPSLEILPWARIAETLITVSHLLLSSRSSSNKPTQFLDMSPTFLWASASGIL